MRFILNEDFNENDYFERFINAIGATKQPGDIWRRHGWYYFPFNYKGKEEMFCIHVDDAKSDATYKNKYIAKNNYGIPFDDLIKLYIKKAK